MATGANVSEVACACDAGKGAGCVNATLFGCKAGDVGCCDASWNGACFSGYPLASCACPGVAAYQCPSFCTAPPVVVRTPWDYFRRLPEFLVWAERTRRRDAVNHALAQVRAERLARVGVGVMSGGELQRVRIAQALASDPVLLLCDEPLLNLDPANARLVASLINQRRSAGTAVMFVTHEVNPVLPYVDRVLYLVDGRFLVGTVAEVMKSATLSELYQADIQVVQVGDRYVVVGEHLDHSGHASGHTHD